MKKNKTKENLVYLLIWILLFLTPILSMMARMASNNSLPFSWEEVLRSWQVFLPFLIVFLIHNYMVAPLLVYKKKNLLYAILTITMLVIFQIYSCSNKPPEPRFMDRGPDGKPAWMDNHHEEHFKEGMPPMAFPDSIKMQNGKEMPRHDKKFHHRHHRMRPDGAFERPPMIIRQHDIIAIIIMVLMLGMNLGIKLFFKSWKDNKAMEELERKNLEHQLENLKHQINPHFFMNTLNNIHALISIDQEEAKHSIVELSKMMRYVLYEGDKGHVMLHQEIEFLKHYVALMRLRYTDKVKISIDIAEPITNKMVPPMLLITFVENAFKHGVSYRKESFIDIHISTTDDRMSFTCRNSKATVETNGKSTVETNTQGGVGLTNARQRLDLIYGDDYKLDIKNESESYEVLLDIPFLAIDSKKEVTTS